MTATLLIVDDDPAIRDVFTFLLAEHGYTVHAAPGGKECIECLRTVIPDLIMLDIMMYPMDGWETLTAIRTGPSTCHIPAIMFSGKNPSSDEIWQYGGWIEDYLMKPINMQAITTALESIFERSRAGQKEQERLLQTGADPRMVDEFLSLRRVLFIHGKFSRMLQRGQPVCEGTVPPQVIRYEELERILSPPGSRDLSQTGKGAT
jgi:CheY-like chemotaxis protein